jgi:hypothetical protein
MAAPRVAATALNGGLPEDVKRALLDLALVDDRR